jgi:predicted DNA-binding protein with PD1-like motif
MQYRLEKNKILISLDRGDEIFDSIHTVIDETGIKFGWINGIGAAENITLGAYPVKIKDYIKKEFEGEFELTSLVGNISTKNGNPFVHIHANISDEECNGYGGHLFSGTITATGELIIFLSDSVVNRKESSEIGLYLWNLNENN